MFLVVKEWNCLVLYFRAWGILIIYIIRSSDRKIINFLNFYRNNYFEVKRAFNTYEKHFKLTLKTNAVGINY